MKIKFAIIGTGNIAHKHAKAIMSIKDTELVAVYSSAKERAENFAHKYKIKEYTDYKELLKNKEITAVDIVTINNLHAELGVLAAKSGKHILIEKPIDTSVEKADELIKSCKENNVKLSVVSQHRFDYAVQWAKKEVEKNTLGDLNLGNVSIKLNRSKNYYESSEKWRKLNKFAGGGVLIMQAIHYIDLLLWFFGEVKSVYGKIETKMHDIEGEDTAVAIIKFKSGAVATIEATTASIKTLKDKFEIHGTKGSIILEGTKLYSKIKTINTEKNQVKKRLLSYFKLKNGTIKDQIQDFNNSIIYSKEPFVTGYDGKKALELILSIYKSSELNKEINLN